MAISKQREQEIRKAVQLQFRQPQQQQPTAKPQAQGAGGLGGLLLDVLPFGRIGEKLVTGRGSDITGGEVGLEAVLSAIPFGLGKVAKGLKGAKGLAKAATKADDVVKAGKGVFVDDLVSEGNLLQRAGKRVEGSIADPGAAFTKSKTGVFTPTKMEDIAELTRRIPGKTAEQKFKALPSIRESLVSQADAAVGSATGKISKSNLIKSFRQSLPGRAGVDYEDLTKAQKTFVDKFFNKVNKKSLNAEDVNAIRRKVNREFSNVQKKIDAGSQLTNKDEALLALKGTLTDTLDSLITDDAAKAAFKTANQQMSKLDDAAKVLKKASEGKVNLPFSLPGGGLLESGRQRAASAIGSKLGKAGDIQATTPGLKGVSTFGLGRGITGPLSAAKEAGVQAGVRLPFVGGGEDAPAEIPTLAEISTPAEPSLETGIEAGQQDEMAQRFRQALLQSLAAGEFEAVKHIQSVAEALGLNLSGKGEELSAKQQGEVGKLSSVEAAVDELEQQFQLAGGGQGRIGGTVSKALGAVQAAPETRVFNDIRQSLIAPLARTISGEVGVLTDRDIKRAEGLLPKITDTPEEAQRRLQILRSLINERRQIMQSGGSAPGIEGGEDAFIQ